MTVRMSAADAQRAGLTPPKKQAPKRTTRRTAPREPGTLSRCVGCGATFTTIAAEDRHVANGHNRYETVLT